MDCECAVRCEVSNAHLPPSDRRPPGEAPGSAVAETPPPGTLEALRDELIACQRLAMLGSLAAMAAHEFNNLMTPLIVRVEASLTTATDAAFTRKTLERALTQAQRAIALSRHLLDFARREFEPTGEASVAAALREAIETAARPFEKDGIELRIAVPEELRVVASEDLLCQVLLNLILNARLAMKGYSGVLAISAVADGAMVQIDVRDSGRGIAPADIESVFNPFLAADPLAQPNDWQQVGLGLSVCRMITRQHGATIQILANEGRGCTFRVRWPRAK
jgi:signal transduction histidine kinase